MHSQIENSTKICVIIGFDNGCCLLGIIMKINDESLSTGICEIN